MNAAGRLPPEGSSEDNLEELASSVILSGEETVEDPEQTLAMHGTIAAALRLVAIMLWILVVVPFVGIPTALHKVRASRKIALFFWKGTRFLFGIKVIRRGVPTVAAPALFVANHSSYLDIVILGSLVEAAFVAKKEVEGWPGVGLMSKIGRTVFIDRLPRHSKTQRNDMVCRFTEDGESLVLFPEGTSSNGNGVLPFKSALLSVAEVRLQNGEQLPVQPVSIAYTRLGGLPMGRGWRSFFAWYGDMEMAPHLWTLLGLGRLTVEVVFHEPLKLEDFGSRKALTDQCYRLVRGSVMQSIAGVDASAADSKR